MAGFDGQESCCNLISNTIMIIECGINLKLNGTYYVPEGKQNLMSTLDLERDNPEIVANFIQQNRNLTHMHKWIVAQNRII